MHPRSVRNGHQSTKRDCTITQHFSRGRAPYRHGGGHKKPRCPQRVGTRSRSTHSTQLVTERPIGDRTTGKCIRMPGEITVNTIVGYILPATSVLPNYISAVASGTPDNTTARNELKPALKTAFDNMTFNPEQRAQVLDLCAKYRSVFSLKPSERTWEMQHSRSGISVATKHKTG